MLIERRGEHAEVRTTVIKLLPLFSKSDVHSRASGLRQYGCKFSNRPVGTQPEVAWMEICDHTRHASEMIGVRMCDDNGIKPLNPATP